MSLVKLAGWNLFGKGIAAAGKTLMQNNTLRNAAIGTGVGAITGAVTAQDGQRLNGALKGGLTGGAVGGVSTTATNMYKNMKPATGGMSFMGALKNEGNILKDSFGNAKNAYRIANPIVEAAK